MHTHYHEPTDTNFNINGDFSGDARIDLPAENADFELSHINNRVSIRVPFEALEFLVAEKYYSENLSKAENAEPVEVMKEALDAQVVSYIAKDPYEEFVLWVRDLADNPEERRRTTLEDITSRANQAVKDVYRDV